MYAYEMGGEGDDLNRDYRDDAYGMPKSIVVDPAFDWEGDELPRTPLHRSIIYEAHVKGFTKLNPDVPEKLRGTYAGMGSEAAINYLKELGITAVELLPIHQHVEDQHLVEKGLKNYWGYNTISYFAPHHSYAASKPGPGVVRRVQGDGQEPAPGGHRGHSSTWFTTTPPRATTSGRRSVSRASTTRRTTA